MQTPVLLGIGSGVTLLAGFISLEHAFAHDRHRVPTAEAAEKSGSPFVQRSDASDGWEGPSTGSAVSLVAYAAARATRNFGVLNRALVCPHCGSGGSVRTKPIVHRHRVRRGSRAALSANVASFASRFSRKRKLMKAHCGACEVSWQVWV